MSYLNRLHTKSRLQMWLGCFWVQHITVKYFSYIGNGVVVENVNYIVNQNKFIGNARRRRHHRCCRPASYSSSITISISVGIGNRHGMRMLTA